ncbi:hypothetical protein LY76DRAFT_632566 [Colletotrichum caudatum]|nr:hypothetical protein LY76DRAFT_632566 [Colletotrichum caudatum]
MDSSLPHLAISCARPAQVFRPPAMMEKRLLDLAAKCVKHAKDLEEEMGYLSPSQPGKLCALTTTPKVVWRKRRLDRLKGNLADAQKLMDTYILERLFSKAEGSFENNEKAFADLSQDLKAFVAQHSRSESALSKLVCGQAVRPGLAARRTVETGIRAGALSEVNPSRI